MIRITFFIFSFVFRRDINDQEIQARIFKEENSSLKAVTASLEQENKRLQTDVDVCNLLSPLLYLFVSLMHGVRVRACECCLRPRSVCVVLFQTITFHVGSQICQCCARARVDKVEV